MGKAYWAPVSMKGYQRTPSPPDALVYQALDLVMTAARSYTGAFGLAEPNCVTETDCTSSYYEVGFI